MKILHVTECVGGGVCRAIDAVVAGSPQHEHMLLSVDPASQVDGGRAFSQVWRFPHGHLARLRFLNRVASELRPEVVHAHSSWAGLYSRVVGLPCSTIYEPHAYAFESASKLKRGLFYLAERILATRADAVVALSPREAGLARKLNPRAKIVLVPNVATIEPPPGPAVSRLRTVVMVGRLTPQKDPGYFSKLSRLVHERDDSIAFRWIGGGDPSLTTGLEGADVTVTGWLDDDQLRQELSTAGLYVHTALYEGFPLSVLDAASCGVPIIARAIPAFDGSAVHQIGTLEALADAIVTFFHDQGLHDRLRANNQALLAAMSPKAHNAALDLLYSSFESKRPHA
ncbi:MAG: glycosyltransferase [Microbacteriaceae bacterium]|nr:MAG: glycosyltransferase [Microbacteriaceae bacterium]